MPRRSGFTQQSPGPPPTSPSFRTTDVLPGSRGIRALKLKDIVVAASA
jgi:hypothetical protein